MRHWILVALLAVATALPAAVIAGTTHSFTSPVQAHPGSRERQFNVYVPDGLSGPAPMVIALHGCRQTHDNVLRDWGLAAAADRHRFILVAPFITSYDGLRNPNCWGFWLPQHRQQGRGEPADLVAIGRQVEARFAVDPRRRYVVGLSSGGAMAVVLSVTHNEYFAAAASAAGLPYGEDAAAVSFSGCPGSAKFHPVERVVADMRAARDSPYRIPLLVLQNNRDCTVVQPAGRNLRDAQLALNGEGEFIAPAKALASEAGCKPVHGADHGCRHSIYTVDGKAGSRSIVETVLYDGPLDTPNRDDTDHGHYWIGGEQGRDGPWAIRRGPSHPDIVWEFFARHGAEGPAPPAPPVCNSVRAAPGSHVQAGRAVLGGWFNSRALSSGDRRDIGFAWDFFWQPETLYESAAGRWFAQRPAGCK
ncbi:PHB depolymerase family esterase [Piscinibacter sakaiensis]|uniref:extracellular catalytic domain type 1 short-chain-length polyhydroxyalkanoate depolymerase n=1 Tax=Piscinibacter sakaiensis TaxID=1547922 RepID=UPI003AADE339